MEARTVNAGRELRIEPGRWAEFPQVAYYCHDFSPPGSRLDLGEVAVKEHTPVQSS